MAEGRKYYVGQTAREPTERKNVGSLCCTYVLSTLTLRGMRSYRCKKQQVRRIHVKRDDRSKMNEFRDILNEKKLEESSWKPNEMGRTQRRMSEERLPKKSVASRAW